MKEKNNLELETCFKKSQELYQRFIFGTVCNFAISQLHISLSIQTVINFIEP